MTSSDLSTSLAATSHSAASPWAADLSLENPPLARSLTVLGAGETLVNHPTGEGELVLGMGIEVVDLRSDEWSAFQQLAEAARGGAGIVLRKPPSVQLRAAAERLTADLAVPLYWLPEDLTWSEAHRVLSESLAPRLASDDELSDLAQTIATLTGGLVTIEDTSSRVLAYSRSSDEVDELRRLSILGRSGPPEYLALLRQWGIYDRLAAAEEVVEIAEHPESGVRRRLAVGIFAGKRQLGTIWVQQGAQDFPPHAAQALLGAARVTATQLVAGRQTVSDKDPTGSFRPLAALLSGRSSAMPSISNRAQQQPCAIAVFELGGNIRDRTEQRLELDELAGIVAVHAAAIRRNAVTEIIDGRVYVLLPSLSATEAIVPGLQAAVLAARQHLRPTVSCAVGPVSETVAHSAYSRRGADLALDSIGYSRAAQGGVTLFEQARPSLAVAAAVQALAQRKELQSPGLAELLVDEPELAETVLLYLERSSQVAPTAAALRVHVTTVRYRLRRAQELAGLNLDDADQRLAAHLQLRNALATGAPNHD
ncbi:PucR family transcriptional regulator [Jatrophihabitans sp. DSM 45814]